MRLIWSRKTPTGVYTESVSRLGLAPPRHAITMSYLADQGDTAVSPLAQRRARQHREAAPMDREPLRRSSPTACSCDQRRDALSPTLSDRAATTSPQSLDRRRSNNSWDQTPSHSRHSSFGHSRSGSDRGYHDDVGVTTPPPPLLSSPSVASSLAFSNPALGTFSPLRRELSHSTLHDDVDQPPVARASRQDLARRLSQLAQRLSYDDTGDDDAVDDLMLQGQLDQLEKAFARPAPSHHARAASFEMRSPRSDDAGSALASPASSLFRSRFSDLSASLQLQREREADRERDRENLEPRPKVGMTVAEAKKVIAEMSKLNDELSTVVSNLRARQEESDHIHSLLIERAERAAQRIIFLQRRIAYLEEELQENDDELQHLRICLKAVEIQLPPHPDAELLRCIATFKHDYQALKTKRANRHSMASSDDASYASP
ncbi:cytochrome P450 [Purpureocillium lavendulum]|uniref:Cytochrome P450 n=1 Tax=Purpureocillium lavendulum TaxID=1247861 RepID=A0AB34FML7_9HYPO|nr:cytochrome P450 [Purpureocillium lavendulum]